MSVERHLDLEVRDRVEMDMQDSGPPEYTVTRLYNRNGRLHYSLTDASGNTIGLSRGNFH